MYYLTLRSGAATDHVTACKSAKIPEDIRHD